MSLQIWLPLNGNTHNKGLIPWEPTGSFVYEDGKMGQAHASGVATLPANLTPSVLNNQTFSYCCWIYPKGTGTGILFGDNSARRYAIYQYPTANDLHISWANVNLSSGTFISKVWTGILPANTWTHIAITYNNPTIKLYVNGVLRDTITAVNASTNYNIATPILFNNSNRRLNDVRIYDHCLSEKEVQEIAKGLCLHYRLTNYGRNNILTNSYTLAWTNDYVTLDKTTHPFFDNRPVYKISRTGQTANSYTGYSRDVTGVTAGQKITVSVWIYREDPSGIDNGTEMRVYQQRTDGSTNWSGFAPALADWPANQWIKVSKTYTLDANLKTAIFNLQVVRNGTFWFTSPKVEFGDSVTQWLPGPGDSNYQMFLPTIEQDCSGFDYHGTIVNAQKNIISGAPRYDFTYQWSAGNYIGLNKLPLNNTSDDFTFAFWMTTTTPGNTMCLWNGRTVTGGSFSIFALGGKFRFDDGTQHTINHTIDKDWHHYAFTRSAAEIKLYVDGELVATTTATKLSGIGIKGTIGQSSVNTSTGNGGNNFVGSLSDYRIYVTTLSEAAIKELYHSAAIVDNTGNAYAYEYKEVEA